MSVPGTAGGVEHMSTPVVSEQVDDPASVLVGPSLTSSDVLLPDARGLAVRVLVAQATRSALPVEVHHLAR